MCIVNISSIKNKTTLFEHVKIDLNIVLLGINILHLLFNLF